MRSTFTWALGAADYPLEIAAEPSLPDFVYFIGFQGEEPGNLGSNTDTLEETAATKRTGQQWVLIRKTTIDL